jgi:alginate O-acetyltransferase complex protein AlgI
MIFNSITFVIFFLVVFFLYWIIGRKSANAQNIILLLSSYFFYGWWSWQFLLLLIFSSTAVFFIASLLEKQNNQSIKKILVNTGIGLIAGLLFLFKYYNFFIQSFVALLSQLSIHVGITSLNLILPLGISFYSFRLISYLLDVYNGKFKPSNNWVYFSTYVSFFPSMLSGPIDRAKLLLPQLEEARVFNYSKAVDGIRQILWGLFKKVVIADTLSSFTDRVFDNFQAYPGSVLLIAAFLYTIQLYADFSGYSDMAIGIAKLLGLEITRNFEFPFFSKNIAEFWKKWHMSLTSWLTDYVFTPLCIKFRDLGKTGLVIAIVINFTICGIWHGSNWTYVLFGFLHGLYFIPLVLKGTLNKKKKTSNNKLVPSVRDFVNMASNFILVMLTFIVFRANSISDVFQFFGKIFSSSMFSKPKDIVPHVTYLFILLTIVSEWIYRDKDYGFKLDNVNKPARVLIYYSVIYSIFYFTGSTTTQFIYVKF